MPVTHRPDKDIGNHRTQLVILDVIVTPGMENTGGMEEEKEKHRHQTQPVNVIAPVWRAYQLTHFHVKKFNFIAFIRCGVLGDIIPYS